MKKFYFIILFFLLFLLNINKVSANFLEYTDTATVGSLYAGLQVANLFEFYNPNNNYILNNIHLKISTTQSQPDTIKAYLMALPNFASLPYDSNWCEWATATRYFPGQYSVSQLTIASTTLSYDLSSEDIYLNFNNINLNQGYYYVLIQTGFNDLKLKGKLFTFNCQNMQNNNLYHLNGINRGDDYINFSLYPHPSNRLTTYDFSNFFKPYYELNGQVLPTFSDFFTLNYPTSTANFPFAFNFTLDTSVFYDLFPDYTHLRNFKLLVNYCNKIANTTSTYSEACVPGTLHHALLNYNIANTTYNSSFLAYDLYSGPALLWVSVITPDDYPIGVSDEYHFNVSSSIPIPPLIADYFSTSSATSTLFNLNTTGICSPPSDGFLSAPIENISYAICKTFSFLFIPSNDQRAYLKNTVFPSFMYSLRHAFPFQYIVQIYDSFVNTINYNPYSGEIVLSSVSPPYINFRILGRDLTMPLTISSSSPFYSLYTYSQNISKLAIYFIMVDILLLMFIF